MDTLYKIILFITYGVVLILSFFGVFVNCFFLYKYLKNGKIDHIKLYKIFLLIMCLLISVGNIISAFFYNDHESMTCKILGTLKLHLEIGIDAIQVSLLVITYYSLEHQTNLLNNPISFKIKVFAFCWILPILTGITEFIYSFNIFPSIPRTAFCMKSTVNYLSIFFFSVLFYLILFIVFLRKLYKSINSIEEEDTETKLQYKKYLKKYYYGFAFSFPNSFYLILLAFLNILIRIWPEIKNKTILYNEVQGIFIFIFLIVNGLSPFAIVLFYFYNWNKLCCCGKETEPNPTTSMILFSSEDNE